MAGTPNRAKQIGQIFSLSAALIISGPANSQMISGGFPPQATFVHELMLIVIGAVLGGFLGPLIAKRQIVRQEPERFDRLRRLEQPDRPRRLVGNPDNGRVRAAHRYSYASALGDVA
jgi:hypothetical protein